MKLHYKLFLTFGIIIAITLIIIFVDLDNRLKNDNYERLRSNIKVQTNACKVLLNKLSTNKVSIQGIAHYINESSGLRVTFISVDGVVIGDSDVLQQDISKLENHLHRPEVQEAKELGEGWSQRFSTTLKKDILYYAVPIKTDDFIGYIRLAIPVEKVSVMSKNIDEVIIFALIIAFLASLIMALIAFNFISLPIRNLAKRANEMAKGDFSSKILMHKRDEVGDLARSLNMMNDNIRARINDIISSNSKFESVLLSMSDGVMVLDPNGYIQLMNNTLKGMLDIKVDPVGKKPIELIRNVNIQDIADDILKRSSKGITKEEKIVFPNNKIILIHAKPVTVNNEIISAVIVFSDITELRKLETVRKDFVANVSHELRTPISSIKGYAETLLDGAINDKENAVEFLNIIHKEAERLATLINDILDLSKIESGNFKLDKANVRIRELTDNALSRLTKNIKDKGIKVSNNVDEHCVANVDENLILQVFINLIHNAVKYSPEGSSINIGSETLAGDIRINIQDSGCGIPEKDLPRIFERFYRVDKARSKALGGTGLGLSIVKHIIQSHGGDVSVKSTEGLGSTFSFTIPLK